jgi:hypothetical protein
MSIFASQTSDTLPMPDGGSVVIRKLTGAEYEEAQSAHLKAVTQGHHARGWSGTFRRQLAKGVATDADVQAMVVDPLNGFDRATVVRCGVVSWTYGDVTPERLADLDDDALELLATEVMRLSKPSLFYRNEEDAEAATKKG